MVEITQVRRYMALRSHTKQDFDSDSSTGVAPGRARKFRINKKR